MPFETIERIAEQNTFTLLINLEIISNSNDLNKLEKIVHEDLRKGILIETLLNRCVLNDLLVKKITLEFDDTKNSLSFKFKLSTRKFTNDELNFCLQSEKIESLDSLLTNNDLNTLKVYLLQDSFSKKFNLNENNKHFLLNNLYFEELNLESN